MLVPSPSKENSSEVLGKACRCIMAEDEAERAIVALEDQMAKLEQMIPEVRRMAAQYDEEQKAIDAGDAGGRAVSRSISHVEGAFAHAALAYTVNSLFYICARAQGANLASHPVMGEVSRVKALFARLKALENSRPETAKQPGDKGSKEKRDPQESALAGLRPESPQQVQHLPPRSDKKKVKDVSHERDGVDDLLKPKGAIDKTEKKRKKERKEKKSKTGRKK